MDISGKTCGRLAVLHIPEEQHDPADQGHKAYQLPPSATINIVQTTCRYCNVRQQQHQRQQLCQTLTEHAQYKSGEHIEQHPPPELRARCTSIEICIFPETSAYRFRECHDASFFGLNEWR